MQEDFRLIIDLVTVLAAAAAGGVLAALLRQPALLGYLLAGVIVGPFGLGLIKELVQVETLAQFGVAFLLFALGVKFSLSEIKKVQGISLGGGSLQILLTIGVTTAIALGLGWVTSAPQGIFLGSVLSLSSTAVVLKCLTEQDQTDTPHAQIMLGILVVQDLAVGLMLAVLPALHQPLDAIGIALAWACLKISGIAIAAIVVGKWILPPILRFLAWTESRELFLLGVVALCLGIALFTEHLGLSIEMGAFLAGLMISEVEYADQTLAYVEPIRDIFATLFFASIGMLIDPVFVWNHWELILGLVSLVILGKVLITTPIVASFGYPWKTAIITGLGLAQIGEFSFVLTSEGQELGLISRDVYLLILGTTAVTLIITPFVLQLMPVVFQIAERSPQLQQWLLSGSKISEPESNELAPQHIVVCGYGRVGQGVVNLLHSYGYPVVVIDQSERAIQQLRQEEIPYIYGNAASLQVLEKAKIHQAMSVVLALPDAMSTRLSLKRSLELSPKLDVVVYARSQSEIELYYQLGASEVVQPDFESSLELSAHLLRNLGYANAWVNQQLEAIRMDHYTTFREERSSFALEQDLRRASQTFNHQWVTLNKTSPLLGLTLADSDTRQLTGATIMILRRANGTTLDYPPADCQLQAGDRLFLVGQPDEIQGFKALANGQPVPTRTEVCWQWITVTQFSKADMLSISDAIAIAGPSLQLHALLHNGTLTRQPAGQTPLALGDRLLVCGTLNQLRQIEMGLRTTGMVEGHSETIAA